MSFKNPVTTVPSLATGSSGPRIVVGSGTELPPGLAAHTLGGAAIVFYQPDGSYYAIGSENSGTPRIRHYYGADAITNPVILAQDAASPAVPAAALGFYHNVYFADSGGGLGQAQILPIVARHVLTFSGSVFSSFAGFGPASYTVDATGWVMLQGLAFNTSGGAASGGALVCTQLPTPLSGLPEPMPTANGAAGPMVLQVDAAGTLTILAGACPAAQNIVLGGIGYQS